MAGNAKAKANITSTSFPRRRPTDRKSTRLNSSHSQISYAVFCLKKKKKSILFLPSEHKRESARSPGNDRIVSVMPVLLYDLFGPSNAPCATDLSLALIVDHQPTK